MKLKAGMQSVTLSHLLSLEISLEDFLQGTLLKQSFQWEQGGLGNAETNYCLNLLSQRQKPEHLCSATCWRRGLSSTQFSSCFG